MSKSQFDSMMVNVWVAGTTDDKGNGGWCSHLHCMISGQNHTKVLGGYGSETTPTRMTLLGVLNALQKLKRDKPVFVKLYVSVHQVSTGLSKNMYNWAKAGWLTTKGEPPQHLDLWQQIHAILTDTTRVITYKVIQQNEESMDNPYRLVAIHHSAEYLAKGKKNLHEYSYT